MNEEEQDVRHFTAEEANALLPKVAPLVEQLQSAQAVMEERQDDVTESIPTNGGGAVHREFLDASTRASTALKELEELGLVVRDPSSGLVDFPALREGEEVLLCWQLGEDEIRYWHGVDEGFAGRKELPL